MEVAAPGGKIAMTTMISIESSSSGLKLYLHLANKKEMVPTVPKPTAYMAFKKSTLEIPACLNADK